MLIFIRHSEYGEIQPLQNREHEKEYARNISQIFQQAEEHASPIIDRSRIDLTWRRHVGRFSDPRIGSDRQRRRLKSGGHGGSGDGANHGGRKSRFLRSEGESRSCFSPLIRRELRRRSAPLGSARGSHLYSVGDVGPDPGRALEIAADEVL